MNLELQEPLEFIDLLHGQSMTLRIDRALDGFASIHPEAVTQRHVRIHMEQRNLDAPPPPGTPITVQIPVLRLFGVRTDQPSNAPYWDVSSKRLRAQLIPLLAANSGLSVIVRITANGVKPAKTYSVDFLGTLSAR